MALTYELHDEAEAELLEIIIFYEINASENISHDFASELFRTIDLIVENSLSFQSNSKASENAVSINFHTK